MERLCTTQEAAEALGIGERTLRKLSAGARPKIPVVRLGGAVRYHLPSIIAHLQGGNFTPGSVDGLASGADTGETRTRTTAGLSVATASALPQRVGQGSNLKP